MSLSEESHDEPEKQKILDEFTSATGYHRKHWKGSTWGYKVHTLLCRWSELPIMFLGSPANILNWPDRACGSSPSSCSLEVPNPLGIFVLSFFAYPRE